jgi:hypothetical protein
MTPRTHLGRLAALAVAGGALFVAPAGAQAAMVVTAKSFSTQEAAPLSRTILATFSDDAAGAPGSFSCSASTYTGTIDWGDGTAPEPVSIAARFGGDFALCEYTVNADHKYAHFGTFTTTISISGGPLAHTATDSGEITVADVAIAGEGKTVNATAGTAFVGEVAEFKDQNPLSQPGDFTSTIDWGDGSLISTGVITGKDGNFSVSGSHVYATTGSFPVRVTLSHPTATPAVALGSASVAPAPPQQQNNQPTLFTPTFSVRGKAKSSGITLKALKSPGLAVQIGASAARTETVEVLRGTSRLGSAKVKVKRGLNKVRFKPSSKLARKLRSGRQYGLRIKVAGEPTLQLTFRIRAPKR